MSALGQAAKEMETTKFPFFGADCCGKNTSKQFCNVECPTQNEGSFLVGSRWLTKEDPDEEFLAVFKETKLDGSEIEGVKKEFNSYFLEGWDPAPSQMIQRLESGQATSYDWVVLGHSRRMIMAEVCLARDPWERFHSAIKCMGPHQIYQLVEQELDPDLRYYQDVRRLADQGNLKEHIRQLNTQLARQNVHYVSRFKSEILGKQNNGSSCATSSYQALEMKRQLMLDKLRKQSEVLGLVEYNTTRAHEVGASHAWTMKRKVSAAVRLSKAERELGRVLMTHQERAERLGCFFYQTETTVRRVLQLLTGTRYSKNEQIILDMAKAAPCLTEEDGPYKPCSAICPYLPDFSKLFRFEKREPVLQIGTVEEDVNRTNANAKNPPKTSTPCARQRYRGGTCSGNVHDAANTGPKVATCVYEEGPPRGHGHPRTATKCFWYALSPFLTLLTHIWGDGYGCKNDGQEDGDEEKANTRNAGDAGTIVQRCTSRFSAKHQLPARKSVTFGTFGDSAAGAEDEYVEGNSRLLRKPMPAHMVPAWDCFCRFVKATVWPYVGSLVERIDDYLFPDNDEPTGVFSFRSTCQEAARTTTSSKSSSKVCPVAKTKRGSAADDQCTDEDGRVGGEGNLSDCNLLRLAAVVQAHLVAQAESTTSICPGDDSPFVQELQKAGSSAAMLTPKELADTIRKQLKEFVATLNAIIDVAEGNGQERNDDSPESREARLRATATTIL